MTDDDKRALREFAFRRCMLLIRMREAGPIEWPIEDLW